MDPDLTILSLSVVVFSIASYAGVSWYLSKRAKLILHKWANAHGFVLIQKEKEQPPRSSAFKGSRTGPGQVIFSFRVRGRDGKELSGSARCGSYLGGVFGDRIEVLWDEK